MQAAHASRRSSRRRARALEMAEPTPRSTATICLDGEDFYKVLHSYLAGIKALDDWIRDGTKVVDAWPFFGPGHDVARTRDGIFTMVYEFEGKSLKVPIQGLNLYLRGFGNEHGKFELDFGDPKFIHDKLCAILDIGVNYHDLVDKSLEKSLTGLWPLRKAVRKLCKYRGGPAADIAPDVATIAIHTSEAERAGPMHSFISRSIVDQSLSRLDRQEGLVIWIRKHSSLCVELMDNINRLHNGQAPRAIKTFGLKINLHDLVIGLRVCYREAYTEGVFKIEPPEGHKEGALGVGEGQRLMPHKIQKGLSTAAYTEFSYIEKGYGTPMVSSYTVKFAMCQIIKSTSIQMAESPLEVAESPGKALQIVESPSNTLEVAESPGKALQIVESPSKTLDYKALEVAESPVKALLQITKSSCKALQIVEFPCKALQLVEYPCSDLQTVPSIVKPNPTIENGYTLKSSSYGARCGLSLIGQRETFHRAKPSYGVNCSLSLMERTSPSCGARCVLSQIAQRATFHRAKPSYGVNCSLSPMERLSSSYSIRGALSQMVQTAKPAYGVNCSLSLMSRLSGQKAVTSSEVNRSCMFGITSTNSRAQVFTTKSKLKTSVDLSIQRTNLGPVTKLGSTTAHENGWANNRPVSRMRFSINLLPSSLSGSFPHQDARRYLYRALRLLH